MVAILQLSALHCAGQQKNAQKNARQAFAAVVDDIFPARLRCYPGEAPMGADPHGSLTGVAPGARRCLTGTPGRDGDPFGGRNYCDTNNIDSDKGGMAERLDQCSCSWLAKDWG
jgi:hypothetical protein